MQSTTARKPITPAQFRNFIFAGRAIFTLENNSTGNYVTFRVKEVKRKGKVVPGQFAIEAKALGDKTYGYEFLGFMDQQAGTFNKWRKTNPEFIGFKTFGWLMKNFGDLERFDKLSIYHEGVCCKCGLPLTVPESIEDGIGPQCKKTILSRSIAILKDMGCWDEKKSYSDNLRDALQKDPAVWGRLHIPEDVKQDDTDLRKGIGLLARFGGI